MVIARQTSTPICLDLGFDNNAKSEFESISEVKSSLDKYPDELKVQFQENDFKHSLDWINPSMRNFINKKFVKNILVIGFNRTCCVKNAVEQIQKYYDVNAFTCEEYLFGNNTDRPVNILDSKTLLGVNEARKLTKKEVEEYLTRNRFIKTRRKKLLAS